MQSILNGINKKDALLLLKALDQYAFTYYEYQYHLFYYLKFLSFYKH